MFDKDYLRRVVIYAIVTVAAVFAVCFIGYHMWLNMTSEIETIPATPQVFPVTAKYDAWVFRDESVVPSVGTGTVVPAVRNGEKIGKNDLVAQLYASVPAEKLTELQSVRSQIRLLESKKSSVIGGDLGIGDIMLSLTSALKNGNMAEAGEISDRLTALVAARATGGGDADTVIASLKEKESAILSSLGTASDSVYSPKSGWYYSDTDGFESVFTTDGVVDITPEKLDELLQSQPSSEKGAGRIVNNYKWYIAAIMDTADGLCFTEGTTTEILLPGLANPLDFRVESVAGGSDGRCAVVFSCGIMPENYTADRHMILEFTLREVEGFGIPKDAVRVLDDVTGVYTYNGVMAKFKKINIIEEIDDLYIAEIQKDEVEKVTEVPATVTGTGEVTTEVTTVVTTEPNPIGGGSGRKDYMWLDVNEFIIVKGRALSNGKLIG